MRLVELETQEEVRLLRMLLSFYHAQGAPRGGGLARGHRYFVGVVDGCWCCGAWLHRPGSFRYVFRRFMVPEENSYFIRRVARFCPGGYLVEFLNLLAERLRSEGKEALVTLGLPNHSNALYRLAGFEEVGVTRTGHPVYVRWLQR